MFSHVLTFSSAFSFALSFALSLPCSLLTCAVLFWNLDMCDLACNTAEEDFDDHDCDEVNAGTVCEYTRDGECDEVEWCAAGTDTADCCVSTDTGTDFVNQVRVWTAENMCNCPEDRVQGRKLGQPVSTEAVCP